MKIAISIVVIVLLGFGAFKLWEYWDQTEREKAIAQRTAGGAVDPRTIQGLPSQLEPQLEEAKQRGPEAFKQFIDNIKRSSLVRDPRLAWIELDYVVMLSGKDPVEAKRLFRKIKQRVEPDSPVYPRIKSLERTFE
jgi:hypothetical protein